MGKRENDLFKEAKSKYEEFRQVLDKSMSNNRFEIGAFRLDNDLNSKALEIETILNQID